MLVEGAPNLRGEIEHAPGDPELRFLEPGVGHPLAKRDVERIQEADDYGEL
jgi:hypothetical protein